MGNASYGKGWEDAVNYLKGKVETARKEGAMIGALGATVALAVVGSLYKILVKKN